MSEYIITDKQLKTATEAYLEHELSRPITEVFISGDKLPKIVRCRDCKWFDSDLYVLPNDENWVYSCGLWGVMSHVPNPDGFCAWAERRRP